LPPSAQAALAAASALNILMVIIFAVTIVIFVMLYLGPYRNPGWITPGFALLLFTFGLAAIGAGEFVREAVRKPYIVYGVVLSNQMLPEEVDRFRDIGFLESGVWTRAVISEEYPGAFRSDGTLDEASLLTLPKVDRIQVGQVIFSFACNDCHSSSDGYSAVSELMRGWSPEMIRAVVDHPERAQFFMPPFAGTGEEAELLTEYLSSIARPFPPGLKSPGG
jgi:mono/diheme cytochrome c family protein